MQLPLFPTCELGDPKIWTVISSYDNLPLIPTLSVGIINDGYACTYSKGIHEI